MERSDICHLPETLTNLIRLHDHDTFLNYGLLFKSRDREQTWSSLSLVINNYQCTITRRFYPSVRSIFWSMEPKGSCDPGGAGQYFTTTLSAKSSISGSLAFNISSYLSKSKVQSFQLPWRRPCMDFAAWICHRIHRPVLFMVYWKILIIGIIQLMSHLYE